MSSTIRFGTDGWRGIIAEDFTFDNVRVCAQGVARYVKDEGLTDRGVVVGYDTRFLSDKFAEGVAQVLAGNGIKSYLCPDPTPTPVVSFGVLHHKAGGGVVITASHNPATWNGFKYKPEYAGSASPKVVQALERNIKEVMVSGEVSSASLEYGIEGGWISYTDLKSFYQDHVSRLVDLDSLRESELKVVVDSMYGAGAGYLKSLLAGGSTSVSELHGTRHPLFPGFKQPEPIAQNLKSLSRGVKIKGANVGLATDGDADRLGIADEKGNILTTLQIFALLAFYLLEMKGERGVIVRSITSTSMIDRLGDVYDVPVLETPVGFKYIGPMMIEKKALMGGEESGGFGFRGHIPERDGILSALYILDFMTQSKKSLSQLLKDLYDMVGPHHYKRVDMHLPQELKGHIIDRLSSQPPALLSGSRISRSDTSDGFKYYLEDGSWLVIRFSGTEPLVRIYAESRSMEQVEGLLSAGRELVGL